MRGCGGSGSGVEEAEMLWADVAEGHERCGGAIENFLVTIVC